MKIFNTIKDFKTYYNSLDKYKKGFWIFLFFIFIEGAMRKWFMPGLSSAWMMCREPIVIWTVLSLMGTYHLKSTVAKAFMFIGVFMLITTMTMGHQNLGVALYGFRIWFFHIPYIFIMASKLNREDLIRICQFLTIVFLPMTLLYVAQWASPPNSWVNMKLGGILRDASEGLRPSGTFLMSPGAAYYNPLVVSIFIATLLSTYYKKTILKFKSEIYVLALAIIITLAVSVSRGTVIQSAVSAIFVSIIYSMCGKTKKIKKLFIGMAIIYTLFIFISKISIGGINILQPITKRFEIAAEQEGGTSGILDSRVFESYRFWNIENPLPLFGYGIGAGSNYGTQTLNIGNGNSWGFGEYSSQIVTNEMGLIFGAVVFLLRIGLCLYLLPKCIRCVSKNNDIMPLCLWTLAINYFGCGNINLTMTFGWIIIVMILLLTSIKNSIPIHE